MKLSVIITAHDEGLLAHKMMMSVLKALEEIDESYEIVVNVDEGDEETVRYFERYIDDARFKILRSEFGDVGEARNHAVAEAEGEFVAFLDADDLVSKNYFAEILKVLEVTEDEVVVHPAYCLTFDDCGNHYMLQKMTGSLSPEEEAVVMFGRNRWVSAISGRRKTFLKYPYMRSDGGFGHEDYELNIRLTERRLVHKIADHTVYFYRRRPDSMMARNNDARKTQPYSALFEIEKWQEFELGEEEKAEPRKRSIKQKLKNHYVKLRNNALANKIITPMASLAKRVTGKKLIAEESLPEDLLEAWTEIAKIEMQLYPADYIKKSVVRYDAEHDSEVGRVYWQLCKQIEAKPDYVFVVPWVVSGGADKVLLNYLAGLEEVHPDWKVAVITMLPVEHEWRDRMAKNSYLVDFGNAVKGLSENDQDLLFTRLLIQLQCKKVQIIHSAFAFKWAREHQELVREQFELYASLFCPGIIPGTNCQGFWSFADPHAARVGHLLKKVYTDNTAIVEELIAHEGFDREKIVVHYQPTGAMANTERKKHQAGKLEILWAGRVSQQKNPELLVRIARKLDPEKVHIDAFGRVDKDDWEGFEFPKDLDTLTYHGAFSGFDSLDTSKYDLFLHTSRFDGMPNIILEAASANLVAIASNVGGIGDFVQTGKTGLLIDDADNEDAYVEVINKVQENPEMLAPLEKNARKLLDERYSWKSFIETMERDF